MVSARSKMAESGRSIIEVTWQKMKRGVAAATPRWRAATSNDQSKGVISLPYRKNNTRPTINVTKTAAHNVNRTSDVRSVFTTVVLSTCGLVIGRSRRG
jgi:hypothetical protein